MCDPFGVNDYFNLSRDSGDEMDGGRFGPEPREERFRECTVVASNGFKCENRSSLVVFRSDDSQCLVVHLFADGEAIELPDASIDRDVHGFTAQRQLLRGIRDVHRGSS